MISRRAVRNTIGILATCGLSAIALLLLTLSIFVTYRSWQAYHGLAADAIIVAKRQVYHRKSQATTYYATVEFATPRLIRTEIEISAVTYEYRGIGAVVPVRYERTQPTNAVATAMGWFSWATLGIAALGSSLLYASWQSGRHLWQSVFGRSAAP